MYTIKKAINSSESTISFSLPFHDWCLLQESDLWERLDKYLEACQSTNIQKTSQERAKILEYSKDIYEACRKEADRRRKITGKCFFE
jgi:hypothetical protein